MTRPRTTAALATSLLLASITTGAAAAQSPVTVSTGYADAHGHVLEVKDLAGADLTNLALTPGQPRTFRVGVRTSAPTLLAAPATALSGYTVESTMTDLYSVDGTGTPSYAQQAARISSADVSVSYATSALEVRGALGRVTPDYLLSTTSGITCGALATSTGLSAVTLATTQTCLLLGGLQGGLSFSAVPVAGSVIDQVDLSGLAATALPLIPAAGVDAGAFTQRDCTRGLALGDPTCQGVTGGTELTMLQATPATAVSSSLLSTVEARVAAANLPLVSETGAGARMRLADALTALQRSASADAAAFANRLVQDFGVADQIKILNGLVTAGVPKLPNLDDVIGFSALNNAFPSLTVSPANATAGTFSGTLTVRLVECPACP